MNPDYKNEELEKQMYQEELIQLIEKGYSTRKAKRELERRNKSR